MAKRTTSKLDRIKRSMTGVSGDTAANYRAAEARHAAKQTVAGAIEKLKPGQSLDQEAAILNRALADTEKSGNKPPMSTEPGDVYGGWSMDTTAKRGIKGRKNPTSSKRAETDPNTGRVPVEDLIKALPKATEKQEDLLTVAKRMKNENIDLEIASSYIEMLAEQDHQNLVEEVLNEMQNILENSFDAEEYKTMYEYVSDVLKEYADPKAEERDGKPGNSHGSSKGQKPKPDSKEPDSSDKEARIRAHMKRVAAKK